MFYITKLRVHLGAFIKLKDAAWAPAVENFLGTRLLSSFCVDNNQDAKLLNSIMKEIFYNENTLQIISSKFFNQVKEYNFLYFNILKLKYLRE